MSKKESKDVKKGFKKTNNLGYVLRKRPVVKLSQQQNCVYVNTKTNFKATFALCENVITKNIHEFTICCMGRAIEKGINVALQLSQKYPSYDLAVNTHTLSLIDDLEPVSEDLEYDVNQRQSSTLYIRFYRNAPA